MGFGPTKHGKFKDMVYQETWVYDIISFEDAKRHAIIPGDKVLAPWEPEGEKFCSGTVITGQEKREAPGNIFTIHTVVYLYTVFIMYIYDMYILLKGYWNPSQV